MPIVVIFAVYIQIIDRIPYYNLLDCVLVENELFLTYMFKHSYLINTININNKIVKQMENTRSQIKKK